MAMKQWWRFLLAWPLPSTVSMDTASRQKSWPNTTKTSRMIGCCEDLAKRQSWWDLLVVCQKDFLFTIMFRRLGLSRQDYVEMQCCPLHRATRVGATRIEQLLEERLNDFRGLTTGAGFGIEERIAADCFVGCFAAYVSSVSIHWSRSSRTRVYMFLPNGLRPVWRALPAAAPLLLLIRRCFQSHVRHLMSQITRSISFHRNEIPTSHELTPPSKISCSSTASMPQAFSCEPGYFSRTSRSRCSPPMPCPAHRKILSRPHNIRVCFSVAIESHLALHWNRFLWRMWVRLLWPLPPLVVVECRSFSVWRTNCGKRRSSGSEFASPLWRRGAEKQMAPTANLFRHEIAWPFIILGSLLALLSAIRFRRLFLCFYIKVGS